MTTQTSDSLVVSNELLHAKVYLNSSGGFDEDYLYDGLYEITTRKQGTLSGGVITGTPVEEEDFTFDPTGNWPGYVIKESGTTTLNQTRTHQTVNEITAISGGVTPGYDANGNMTAMPQVDNWSTAQTLTYDAWNRPITVKQSTTTLGTYQYDGLNRRIWKQSLESGTLTTRHFYYSNQWQVLEERTDSNTTADTQYVWGTRYRDDLVLRDRLMGTTDRFYALADYFQPTAIADTSGVVQERYVYRAFGDVSYYNGSFGTISSSAYEWEYLYGTYYYDIETALYQVRNRYYHSTLGRWLSRDPLLNAELSQGANLYWYVSNNAVNAVDPLGLACCCCVDKLTVKSKGKVVGSVSVGDYYPSGVANAPDGDVLGTFDSGGAAGVKFQVIGKHHKGKTSGGDCQFSQDIQETDTKGGTPGPQHDDMRYTDAGGGVHNWDPNSQTGTSSGSGTGINQTINESTTAYTDPPAIPTKGNQYRKLDFTITYASDTSAGCGCKTKQLTKLCTQEIEVMNGNVVTNFFTCN